MRLAVIALSALVVVSDVSTALANGVCDLRVWDTNRRQERLQEADGRFEPFNGRSAGLFGVCFRPLADGYVSLWDQFPLNRGQPNLIAPNKAGDGGVRAIKVTAGREACFGVRDGLILFMEGQGTGRLQLVFSDRPAGQPNANRQIASSSVVNGQLRSGAGALSAARASGWTLENPPDGINCKGHKRLTYQYVVE